MHEETRKPVALIGQHDLSVLQTAGHGSLTMLYYLSGIMRYLVELMCREPTVFLTDLATADMVNACSWFRYIHKEEAAFGCFLPTRQHVDMLDGEAMALWSQATQRGYGDYRYMIDRSACLLAFLSEENHPAVSYALEKGIPVRVYHPTMVMREGYDHLSQFAYEYLKPLGILAQDDPHRLQAIMRHFIESGELDFNVHG